MKREVQSSIRVTPMPKLNRELPPRWRSPDSQVATASSVLYLAQSGWVMTPALLMTGSTDVQPVCSRPVVKIRNRIRISTYQIRLCVNLFKVLQQVYVSLIVHLIVPLFFQRVVKEKLICNTNRFFLQELGGLWRESDFEELVGVTHSREWSRYANKRFQKHEKHLRPCVGLGL